MDTLSYWLEEFLGTQLALIEDVTKQSHRLNLRRFGEFLQHEPTIADLNERAVMGAVSWLRSRQFASVTVAKFKNHTARLWEFAWRKQAVQFGPTLPRVPIIRPDPVALTPDQCVAVWRIIQLRDGWILNIPERLWWSTLIGMLWATGERRGPLYKATWAEIDFANGLWNVPKEHRKGAGLGRARGMTYPLHKFPALLDLLRELKTYNHEFVWPIDVTPTTEYRYLAAIMVGAGLPDKRAWKYHCFRRTVATLVEVLGGVGESAKVMQWADPTMRERYVDMRQMPVDGAAMRLPWIGDMRVG